MDCEQLRKDITRLRDVQAQLQRKLNKMDESGKKTLTAREEEANACQLETETLERYLQDFAEQNPEIKKYKEAGCVEPEALSKNGLNPLSIKPFSLSDGGAMICENFSNDGEASRVLRPLVVQPDGKFDLGPKLNLPDFFDSATPIRAEDFGLGDGDDLLAVTVDNRLILQQKQSDGSYRTIMEGDDNVDSGNSLVTLGVMGVKNGLVAFGPELNAFRFAQPDDAGRLHFKDMEVQYSNTRPTWVRNFTSAGNGSYAFIDSQGYYFDVYPDSSDYSKVHVTGVLLGINGSYDDDYDTPRPIKCLARLSDDRLLFGGDNGALYAFGRGITEADHQQIPGFLDEKGKPQDIKNIIPLPDGGALVIGDACYSRYAKQEDGSYALGEVKACPSTYSEAVAFGEDGFAVVMRALGIGFSNKNLVYYKNTAPASVEELKQSLPLVAEKRERMM